MTNDKTLQQLKSQEAGLINQARLMELLNYDQDTGVFTWKVRRGSTVQAGMVAGSPTVDGYRRINIGGKHYRAHRLAWLWVHGTYPSGYVDHINGKRDDNRIANLRDVPKHVNQQNQKKAQKNNCTGLLGVHFAKTKVNLTKRFEARITISNRLKSLGYFSTAEEAHAAYVAAKRRNHEGCTL